MSKPIKLGIIGIGRAGWGMHCKELIGKENKFKIVAACDLIVSRREKMKEKYGCRTYERIEDLITDPDVELVDIATSSCDHFEHAVMAIEAGKDVFLEKPMTMTYEEAVILKNMTSDEKSPNLYIRHNRRFEPGFIKVKEIMASGVLGNVYQIKLARQSFGRRDDWQTIQKFGGGQLLNWGPHIIDHSLRFLEDEIECFFSDCKNVISVGDSEDNIKIVFKGKSGLIVDMEISGGVAISSPEYQVYGDRGSLILQQDEIQLKYIDPKCELIEKVADSGTPGETFGAPENIQWVEENFTIDSNDISHIWNELYMAIREGSEFPISMDEALRVMKIITQVKENEKGMMLK